MPVRSPRHRARLVARSWTVAATMIAREQSPISTGHTVRLTITLSRDTITDVHWLPESQGLSDSLKKRGTVTGDGRSA